MDSRRHRFQSSRVLQAPSLKWTEISLTLAVPAMWDERSSRPKRLPVFKRSWHPWGFVHGRAKDVASPEAPRCSCKGDLEQGREGRCCFSLWFSLAYTSFLRQKCSVGLSATPDWAQLCGEWLCGCSVWDGRPVCRRETTSGCVQSPGNPRPFHICSPSRGQEEITKTFQQGARAGRQRESLKPLVTLGHMTTPWSSSIPFHPLRSPTLSLFIILQVSRIGFMRVDQKAYQTEAEAGVCKPPPCWKLGWTRLTVWLRLPSHTNCICFPGALSSFPLFLVWNP